MASPFREEGERGGETYTYSATQSPLRSATPLPKKKKRGRKKVSKGAFVESVLRNVCRMASFAANNAARCSFVEKLV